MKQTTKLRIKPLLEFLCIVPFAMLLSTVLIVDQHFINDLANGKPLWFILSTILVSIASIVSQLIMNKHVVYTRVDVYIVILSVIGMLSIYQYNREVNSEMILMCMVLYLFIYFRAFLSQSYTNRFAVTLLFVFTGLAEAVWGMLQKHGIGLHHSSEHEALGSFSSTEYYAAYIAMILPLAVYYTVKDWKYKNKSVTKVVMPHIFRLIICTLTILFILPALFAAFYVPACIAATMGSIYVVVSHYLYPSASKYIEEKIDKKLKRRIFIVACISLISISGLYGVYIIAEQSTTEAVIRSNNLTKESVFGFTNLLTNKDLNELPSFKQLSIWEIIKDIRTRIVVGYMMLGVIVFGTLYLGIKKRKIGLIGSFISIMLFSLACFPFHLLPFCIAITFLIPACTLVKPRPLEEEYLVPVYHIEEIKEDSPKRLILEGFFTGLLWISISIYLFINYI